MIEHKCALPLMWRHQSLTPGSAWRCTCGKVRVLVDTHRPQHEGSRLRFEMVHAPASRKLAVSP